MGRGSSDKKKTATAAWKLADAAWRNAKRAGLLEPDLGIHIKQEDNGDEEEEVGIFQLASNAGISHMLDDEYFGGRYCI